MLLSRLLPAGAALVLLAAPALAGSGVEVADPCGDTDHPVLVDPAVDGTSISVGPAEVTLGGPRVDGFDLEQVRVGDLVRGDAVVGVEVALQVCGVVAPSDTPGSRWAVAWDLPARPGTTSCYGEVRLTDRLVGSEVVRDGFLSETCSRDGGPLGGSTATTEYDVPLEDWEVAGDTVTWRLERGAAGAGEGQLEPGTPWAGLRADSRDGQQGTRAEYEAPTTQQQVRAGGPGASDRTDRGGDLVVG